jgi:NAD(P)H-dependent FMN reductase
LKLFAISGSLRAVSSNTALLRAVCAHAPPSIQAALFEELESVPAFNPDREAEAWPPAVEAFRAGVRDCEVVLISTPEYAHGVPGALKNALDWLVGSGEFYEKPVALLHVSERGAHARASLKETLVTMGARIVFDDVVNGSDADAVKETIATIVAAAVS